MRGDRRAPTARARLRRPGMTRVLPRRKPSCPARATRPTSITPRRTAGCPPRRPAPRGLGKVPADKKGSPPGNVWEGEMWEDAAHAAAPTMAELRRHRDAIERIAAVHGAANVRVCGSVARGDAQPDSDIDLVVDMAGDRDA